MLYAVAVIGVSALLACVGWIAASDVLALNKEEHSVTVTITPEDSYDDVVDMLKDNGLIEYKSLFKLFSRHHRRQGQDRLFRHLYPELRHGLPRPDLRHQRQFRLLGSGGCHHPGGLHGSPDLPAPGGEGGGHGGGPERDGGHPRLRLLLPPGHSLGDPERLEGYLFPATYEFYTPHNPLYAINKMLQTFDAQFTDEMRQEVADSGRTIHEVLTVASMIEKETDGEDRGKIASVIYNRLNNPGASAGTNGYLQIDATLAYLNGGQGAHRGGQVHRLPLQYLSVSGLPPGPIANPGLESIKAAMEPESTSYYYYTLGDDNKHHFFNTYGEMTSFMSTQALYSGG